jgi:predicted Zn-ribbon and HTH transcriptional regulator
VTRSAAELRELLEALERSRRFRLDREELALIEEIGRVRAALEAAEELELEPAACAECGHLHYAGASLGYIECPIEGCLCRGQSWRDEPAIAPAADTAAEELELAAAAALIRRPGERRRPGLSTLEPGVRLVGGRRLYSSAWL